jgi:hypothetical protein
MTIRYRERSGSWRDRPTYWLWMPLQLAVAVGVAVLAASVFDTDRGALLVASILGFFLAECYLWWRLNRGDGPEWRTVDDPTPIRPVEDKPWHW